MLRYLKTFPLALLILLVVSTVAIVGYFAFKNDPKSCLAAFHSEFGFQLSLAYISSLIFYVITVRYPYRKKFKAVEPIIAVRLYRLINDYVGFLKNIGIDDSYSVSKNLMDQHLNCIDLKSEAPISSIDQNGNPVKGNRLCMLGHINKRREDILQELLNRYNEYLHSDIVDCLLDMQEFSPFFMFRGNEPEHPGLFEKADVSYRLSGIGGVDSYYRYYKSILKLRALRDRYFPFEKWETFQEQ